VNSDSIITEYINGALNTYQKQKYLGKGSFSRVYEIKEINTSKTYAVKIIEKNNMKEKDFEAVKREINLHKSLDHPHILKLIHTFEDTN